LRYSSVIILHICLLVFTISNTLSKLVLCLQLVLSQLRYLFHHNCHKFSPSMNVCFIITCHKFLFKMFGSTSQGLTYANGVLYESTGLYKESKVRRHDMSTGEILNGINIPKEYFGEGLAYYPKNNTLIQLTWKKRSVFIYDADSLQQLNKIQFQTGRNEGWGITYYPIMDVFIVSDGSNNLYFWDVVLMQEISRVSVTWQDGSPRDYLNELEYDPVTGLILSNVWYEDYIVAIDPTSGVIKKKLDLEFVWPKKDRPKGADVLNGISVTNEPGVFLITGKKWPKMYFVKLG